MILSKEEVDTLIYALETHGHHLASNYGGALDDDENAILNKLVADKKTREEAQPKPIKKFDIVVTGGVNVRFAFLLTEVNGRLIGTYMGEYFDATINEVEHNQ